MIKLSASSIGTYKKCPKRYHYQYIEKPEVPMKDWTHLEFGKCAHRVLELFHEELLKKVIRPESYPRLMGACFKKALSEHDADMIRDELSFLKEILHSYLDRIKRDGLPNVISNELEFKFMIDKFMMRGYIDRIDKIEDGWYHVADYKTNKNPKYLTPFQLKLYALAIKEEYDDVEKVTGEYILLKHNCSSKEYSFTDEDLEETRENILKVGKSIDTRTKWEKKPSILCRWCDYENICQNQWI